ncbi:MAG: hypothetical protein R6V41_13505 [Desulfobacteraceae bacterium]
MRALKALFNFGIKPPNRWFLDNPTDGVQFFPTESREKYVPPVEDVIKVLLAAEGQVQDYLWTIALTMGRVSEVNRLRWNDVDFNKKKESRSKPSRNFWGMKTGEPRKSIFIRSAIRTKMQWIAWKPR